MATIKTPRIATQITAHSGTIASAIGSTSIAPPIVVHRYNHGFSWVSVMPPTATSNVNEVNAWLKKVVAGFNFDLTVESESLGKDCANIIAEEIAVRSADGRGADGYWPENTNTPSPQLGGLGYRDWKQLKYGVGKPNIRTGQMISIESLLGTVTVTTDAVTMLYGTGDPPTRSAASSYFNPRTDGAITDIEKAYFCSVAYARPFYELDDDMASIVFRHIEETLAEYLQRQ